MFFIFISQKHWIMHLMLQNTLYSWKVVLSFHMLLTEEREQTLRLLNIQNPDVFVSNARPHSSVCCLFILLWMLLNRCDSAACHLDSSREAQTRSLMWLLRLMSPICIKICLFAPDCSWVIFRSRYWDIQTMNQTVTKMKVCIQRVFHASWWAFEKHF